MRSGRGAGGAGSVKASLDIAQGKGGGKKLPKMHHVINGRPLLFLFDVKLNFFFN